MKCQLCGFEFNQASLPCHSDCPMGGNCHLICCPNCGYQVVDETKSGIANFFSRLWPSKTKSKISKVEGKRVTSKTPVVPLTHIPVGKMVSIRKMDKMPAKRLAQLSVFGLIPGGKVKVIQRNPAPVIRIDETELAVSEEILQQIWVLPGNGKSD